MELLPEIEKNPALQSFSPWQTSDNQYRFCFSPALVNPKSAPCSHIVDTLFLRNWGMWINLILQKSDSLTTVRGRIQEPRND